MSREIGKIGEDLACEILTGSGYKIIERNYFARFGEIDIIAKENNDLVFIEVKYRKDEGFGSALDAVTRKKLKKIHKSALIYLSEKGLTNVDWRVDVIGISPDTKKFEILENVYVEGIC